MLHIVLYVVNIAVGWLLPEGIKKALRLKYKNIIWTGSSSLSEMRTEEEIIDNLEPITKYFGGERISCSTNKHPTIGETGGAYHYVLTPEKPNLVQGVSVLGNLQNDGTVTVKGIQYHVYKTMNLFHTNDALVWEIVYARNTT